MPGGESTKLGKILAFLGEQLRDATVSAGQGSPKVTIWVPDDLQYGDARHEGPRVGDMKHRRCRSRRKGLCFL